jgi:hypothetical protein
VKLLSHKDSSIRCAALYGLKMVGDGSVVKDVVKMLDDAEPAVREMGANALCHIGNDDAVKALQEHKTVEKDPYVLASVEAALKVLALAKKPYAKYPSGKVFRETLAGPDGAKSVAWTGVFRNTSLFADHFVKPCDIPVADSFCYPVSRYKDDSDPDSFGYAGNHAGEDCAWFRDGCSYYAIADGVVRMVQGAGSNWGFLVAIEHKLPNGEYIVSVYGHTAWDILVSAGDTVRKGQKIATEGLAFSAENGGYGSHLHFGIGDGPFRRSKKHAKGDALAFTDDKGKRQSGKIVRFAYSDRCGKDGSPLVVALVESAEGVAGKVELDEEPLPSQTGWLRGHVEECRGWMDPHVFLAEHVKEDGK